MITRFFIFFLSLWDGTTAFIRSSDLILTGKESENFTHACNFVLSGKTKIFCRRDCKEDEDILVKTNHNRSQSGRYAIEYKQHSFASHILNVSITNLRKSDAGFYRCKLDRWALDSEQIFEIRVEDAPVTLVPSVSTAQRSTYGSEPSSVAHDDQLPAAGPGWVLLVGLVLSIMILGLSAGLVMLCRTTSRKPREHPVETHHDDITEVNQVYDEIREDRRKRTRPSEISTIYAYLHDTRSDADETTDLAATPQLEMKEDSNKLIYSLVNFQSSAAPPCGEDTNVPFKDTPLYSTITSYNS
ncbi:uncharacterized protein [Antennarius striatus]|uniref:uncharacterized protein isoform X2 n=1 Tax=Antennarius striatus TaxID=241820 RepID=UPI0035B22A2B